jgi:hypothetical protein
MMKDPAFLKEMERIKSDPKFANAVQSAKNMYTSRAPPPTPEVLGQVNKGKREQTDAQLGLAELAKTTADPKLLAEAMEMLKDPETAAEVSEEHQR